MNQRDHGQQFLTIKQAAQRLGLCDRTIWNAVKRGELAAARVGRRILISVAGLDAFIAARAVPSVAGTRP